MHKNFQTTNACPQCRSPSDEHCLVRHLFFNTLGSPPERMEENEGCFGILNFTIHFFGNLIVIIEHSTSAHFGIHFIPST